MGVGDLQASQALYAKTRLENKSFRVDGFIALLPREAGPFT